MPINVAELTKNTALHFVFILAKVFFDFCQLPGIIKRDRAHSTHLGGLQATSPPTSLGRL